MSESLDDRRDVAAIHPLRFWTAYNDNGTEADWVEWTKKGATVPTTTADKIDRVKKDQAVWSVLRRYYEAWKEHRDAPVNGVPLDVAPFASPELVEALARFHIRSVEDLANLEDAQLGKTGIPGLRGLRVKAQTYLQARETTAPLMGELEALRAQVAALQAEREAPRRRKREEAPAEAEAEA